MAVLYKKYQNQNSKVGTAGKWYARVATGENVDTEALSEAIQEKCTVHAADVLAVIKALVGEMQKNLQAGKRVVLDGFGAFKVGMTTTPAESAETFTVAQNIKGLRVIFQPEVHIDRATKTRTVALLAGTVVKEASEYKAQ